MRQLIILPFAALALTACGTKSDDGNPGTDISIDATTDEGSPVKASSDGKTGEIAIDVPGFKANIAMPKIKLDADNFDIDGVKLYPGSKIVSMKAEERKHDTGDGKGNVQIRFDAPATPDVVKAWFVEKLTGNNKFTITQTASGLTGRNEDGAPFTLDAQPGATGHTVGTIIISGK
ncbi:MAG: hypothetical protein AABY88_08345 [Pseudomonadota bacterium]